MMMKYSQTTPSEKDFREAEKVAERLIKDGVIGKYRGPEIEYYRDELMGCFTENIAIALAAARAEARKDALEEAAKVVAALEWALPSAEDDVEKLGGDLSGPSITLGMKEEYEAQRANLEKARAALARAKEGM